MDEIIPSILESDGSSKSFRQNWARLIQKIYEVDPLTCPKCSGAMKVISVIENEDVIRKVLKHLGRWDLKARPPPKGKTVSKTIIDYSARPGATHFHFVDETIACYKPDFCVYSTDDRSGPGNPHPSGRLGTLLTNCSKKAYYI